MDGDEDNQPEDTAELSPPPGLAVPGAPDEEPEEEALAQAREQERLHRKLQAQPAGDDERPPIQRERDAAIDAAIEDVERSVQSAHERSADDRDAPGRD